jgi:hypothetical protein
MIFQAAAKICGPFEQYTEACKVIAQCINQFNEAQRPKITREERGDPHQQDSFGYVPCLSQKPDLMQCHVGEGKCTIRSSRHKIPREEKGNGEYDRGWTGEGSNI